MSTEILTTHAGSLPRSQRVVDFIFARERGDDFERAAFDTCMTEETSDTVQKQVAAGIDIVSDGETSKISYATYIKDRYTGFAGDCPRNPPADLEQFPNFLQRVAQSGGTPQFSRPFCEGEIKMKDDHDLQADIANLKSALEVHGAKQGFMNAPSPGVVSLFLPNNYFANHETYLVALADALRFEYETIVAAGLTLQLDCPDLGLARHVMYKDVSDEEFVRKAELHVETLNAALANVPENMIRIHICWGNYEGPHICDIEMNQVFPILMKVKSRYVLFESSNPRHAHEWTIFRDRKNEIPEDKVLVPGVLDTTTNFVEHPKLVKERIERFVAIVGKERVIAGSDCGFGTFAGFGAVDPEIAYEKLKALSEGASLVA